MVWQQNEKVDFIKGYEMVLKKIGGTRVIHENTFPLESIRPMLPIAMIVIREYPRFYN